jgi:hypothetical protein
VERCMMGCRGLSAAEAPGKVPGEVPKYHSVFGDHNYIRFSCDSLPREYCRGLCNTVSSTGRKVRYRLGTL